MNLPDLEPRFLPPEGWAEDFFENPDSKHKIRYGFVKHETPLGTVVLLGGLSEFAEKYFETIHDLIDRKLSVFTMDWAYQGLSTRTHKNIQRRHSDGYEQDISDLHFFINNYVQPQSKDLPLILVGHSMGGHIGIRYLMMHPGIFKTAAFSAPMLGIKQIQLFEIGIKILLILLKPFKDRYVPGGSDWHEKMRKSDGSDIFSSDPLRDQIHNAWCLHNPNLQVGSPTLGWLWESMNSIRALDRNVLSKIQIPALLTAAGEDQIVVNQAIQDAATNIPNAEYLEIQGAHHEILMEQDQYRMQFFKAFDDLLKQAKITP